MDPYSLSLDTIKEWSTILAAHQWPILILAIVLIFRDELRKALDLIPRRIKSYKGFGGELVLGDLLSDKPMQPPSSSTIQSWSNIHSVFGLGQYLVATMGIVLLEKPGPEIVDGLQRAVNKLRQLPLTGTNIEKKLEKLIAEAQDREEKDWTNQERYKLVKEIRAIADEIMEILKKQQKSKPTLSS